MAIKSVSIRIEEEMLEKLGFDSHSSVWLWAFLNHHFPISVTDIIPTLWCCSEDVKHLR